MSRLPAPPRVIVALVCLLATAALAGCGGNYDKASKGPDQRTAKLFNERCSGCHTLEAANAYGSKPEGQLAGGERTNGPNFNQRKVDPEDALYAIRNGGFSGAIMPANIAVGKDADALAEFVGKYSGGQRDQTQPGRGNGP